MPLVYGRRGKGAVGDYDVDDGGDAYIITGFVLDACEILFHGCLPTCAVRWQSNKLSFPEALRFKFCEDHPKSLVVSHHKIV